MDFESMGTQHEGFRIQNNQRRAWLNTRRACRGSVSFGQEGRQQYRTRSQECKFANDCVDAIISRAARKEIQGITESVNFFVSQRNRSQRAEIVRRTREYLKAVQFDSDSLVVNFFCTKNDDPNSDLQSSDVIDFAARLFHLASKRGRVKSTVDEVFNEAI